MINKYEWFAKNHAVFSMEIKIWIKAFDPEMIEQWSGTKNISPLKKEVREKSFGLRRLANHHILKVKRGERNGRDRFKKDRRNYRKTTGLLWSCICKGR
ncbi:hypothetical protein [Wukongibacter sp. M2B1]|uniref:hypothetical protein n=1 Tax=Wukongibacter sp. M2B1 TaxID=3088895 RepID=UPI003D7A10E2